MIGFRRVVDLKILFPIWRIRPDRLGCIRSKTSKTVGVEIVPRGVYDTNHLLR